MDLAAHRRYSTAQSYLYGWVVLVAVLTILLLIMSFSSGQLLNVPLSVLFSLGVITCWRYGWQAVHGLRALIYSRIVFPRLRRAAVQAAEATHVYVVVLSFRMQSEVNAAVYSALLRDLRNYGRPATIVACVSDHADVVQIDQLVRPADNICLLPLLQSRLGKRDGMERALDLLVRRHPVAGSVVALVDGDTFLAPGTLGASIPLLLGCDGVGAVTTDNIPLVAGRTIVREWYRLRMRARHLLMCSMSLSRRVLVLTGRFSLFRSEVALSRGFIAMLGNDLMRHPRLGNIPMLTGDDKSTWYWTLRAGWDMLYLPDVVAYCMEKPPTRGFFRSTTALMTRYYGNMVRSNGRALALGPTRVGWFTWLTLLDQRISPWTSLSGPMLAVLLTLVGSPYVLPIYLVWAITVRLGQTALIGGFGRAFHPLFPLLHFYNHLVGSLIKIHTFFHPDRQRWTRQGTGAVMAAGNASSALLMGMALLAFALSITVILVSGRN